ncbi:MAG: DUF3343 domain-containing protein [Clostridia bacterium]|nr:DUF3343 domain-containing protein [Clostridia bacterium]
MDKPIIMLSSLTIAMKSKDILSYNNIISYVKRTPNSDKNTGCGYGLYIPKNLEKAIKLLKERNIKIIKVIGDEKDRDIS